MITRLTKDNLMDVATLYVDSWHQTYQQLVPKTYLDTLNKQDTLNKWTAFLQHTIEKPIIYGAYDYNGKLLGFVALRNVTPYQGEVYALYLASEAKGRGLGRKLVNQAKSHFTAEGCQEMLIWVMKANQPAVQFYQHLGGQLIDHRMSEFDDVLVEDEAYRWSLS